MERKYYRQYENFNNVIPNASDFPVINQGKTVEPEIIEEKKEVSNIGLPNLNIKLDDIVIIAIIILLLCEEQKDSLTIILLAILFLSEYIF